MIKDGSPIKSGMTGKMCISPSRTSSPDPRAEPRHPGPRAEPRHPGPRAGVHMIKNGSPIKSGMTGKMCISPSRTSSPDPRAEPRHPGPRAEPRHPGPRAGVHMIKNGSPIKSGMTGKMCASGINPHSAGFVNN